MIGDNPLRPNSVEFRNHTRCKPPRGPMLIAYIRIIESGVEWHVSIGMFLCEFVIINCYYALTLM